MNSTLHIPKAEIHVHLEATITPSLCRKFAERNKVKLSEDIFGSEYAYQWEDFYDFIKRYDIVTGVIYTPEDYYELTYEYLKECASYNVLYVEAMVSSTHAKAKGMTYHSFLDSVHQASQDAERDFGIVSRYLMNGIRHLGADSVQETAKEVLNNPHPALVGFGLAGDELHFPPNLFNLDADPSDSIHLFTKEVLYKLSVFCYIDQNELFLILDVPTNNMHHTADHPTAHTYSNSNTPPLTTHLALNVFGTLRGQCPCDEYRDEKRSDWICHVCTLLNIRANSPETVTRSYDCEETEAMDQCSRGIVLAMLESYARSSVVDGRAEALRWYTSE